MIFKRGIIYNCLVHKIRQALCVTYRTTGSLFRTYYVSSAVYTMTSKIRSKEKFETKSDRRHYSRAMSLTEKFFFRMR